MAFFTTLYSGSSGNCGVVWLHKEFLLIDIGKGIRITEKGLRQLGLAPQDCIGVLVTHTHSDHVGGLQAFLKKYPTPVYAVQAVLDELTQSEYLPQDPALFPLDSGKESAIGEFLVSAFPTSHDVPCCGFRITCADGRLMAIATDIGCLTPAAHVGLADAHLVAIEANYDRAMLQNGPYPSFLKQRVGGKKGHLSNDECVAKVLELMQQGCTRFALCHMSKENNTVERLFNTLRSVLSAAQVVPSPETLIRVMKRTEPTEPLEF